jgi:hypothetical protein
MSPMCVLRVIDGLYVPGMTTDGRDFLPITNAADKRPMPAIRYADMRNANVSPLRSSDDDPASAPPAGSSPEQPTGSSTASPDVLTR